MLSTHAHNQIIINLEGTLVTSRGDIMTHTYTCKLDKGSQYSLPPLRLISMLPLSTVHPLRACAAVTESTIFWPIHTLGHSPAHGVQINLQEEMERAHTSDRDEGKNTYSRESQYYFLQFYIDTLTPSTY